MLASFHAVADARRLTSRWGGCSRVLRHTRARGLAGFDPEARARAAPKRGRQSARPTRLARGVAATCHEKNG